MAKDTDHAELVILSMLEGGRMYGYAISKEVASRSENRLRLTQEGAEVGIWDWDLRDNSVYHSPACLRLYGLAPGRLHDRRLHPLARRRRARVSYGRPPPARHLPDQPRCPPRQPRFPALQARTGRPFALFPFPSRRVL